VAKRPHRHPGFIFFFARPRVARVARQPGRRSRKRSRVQRPRVAPRPRLASNRPPTGQESGPTSGGFASSPSSWRICCLDPLPEVLLEAQGTDGARPRIVVVAGFEAAAGANLIGRLAVPSLVRRRAGVDPRRRSEPLVRRRLQAGIATGRAVVAHVDERHRRLTRFGRPKRRVPDRRAVRDAARSAVRRIVRLSAFGFPISGG
jgi:hypothetical protein